MAALPPADILSGFPNPGGGWGIPSGWSGGQDGSLASCADEWWPDVTSLLETACPPK